MTYAVQNQSVYSAAFAGCMSGMKNSNFVNVALETGETNYGSIVADAFAQEVDTLWGSSRVPNIFDIPAIQSSCGSIFHNRILPPMNSIVPSMFTQEAQNIILTIADCDTQIEADGVTLPAYGGGSSVSPVSATLAASFVQPAVGSNVDATLSPTGWVNANLASGQSIYIEGGGWYQVNTVADPIVNLQNIGGVFNGDPAETIAEGSQVLPPNIDFATVPTSAGLVSSRNAGGTWGSFTDPVASVSVFVQAGQQVRLTASLRCLLGTVVDPAYMQAAIYYTGATIASTPITGGICCIPVNSVQPNATFTIVTWDETIAVSGIVTYILVGIPTGTNPVELMDFSFSAETVNLN